MGSGWTGRAIEGSVAFVRLMQRALAELDGAVHGPLDTMPRMTDLTTEWTLVYANFMTRTLRVPEDLHAQIQSLAKAEGRFMREIVRRAIGLYQRLGKEGRAAVDFTEALDGFETTIKELPG